MAEATMSDGERRARSSWAQPDKMMVLERLKIARLEQGEVAIAKVEFNTLVLKSGEV